MTEWPEMLNFVFEKSELIGIFERTSILYSDGEAILYRNRIDQTNDGRKALCSSEEVRG